MAPTDIAIGARASDIAGCCPPGLGTAINRSDAEQLARVLKAVAEPTRLQLISLIAASGEACACDLYEPVGLTQPTVSHHLKVLTDAGLIEREQRGTWAWFRINPAQMASIAQIFTLD